MRRWVIVGCVALLLAALTLYLRRRETEPPLQSTPTTTQSARASAEESAFPPARSDSAVSPNTPEQDEEYRRWARTVVDALIARDDGESLIVAALIVQNRERNDPLFADVRSGVVKLFTRASQRAPMNAAVQWLALMGCQGAAERQVPCDVASYELALTTADPTNGFSSLGKLGKAVRDNDRPGMEQALATMASASNMKTYYATVEPLLLNTIESVRVPPPADRVGGYAPAQLLAIGVSAALPLPPTQHLREACKVKINDPRMRHCMGLTEVMRRSDSYFVRRLGLRVAEDLLPYGSPKASENSEEQRKLDWLAYQVGQVPFGPEVTQRLLPQAEGEVEFWKLWLRENGIPLEPPIDWAKP